jgi:hypothetical protein
VISGAAAAGTCRQAAWVMAQHVPCDEGSSGAAASELQLGCRALVSTAPARSLSPALASGGVSLTAVSMLTPQPSSNIWKWDASAPQSSPAPDDVGLMRQLVNYDMPQRFTHHSISAPWCSTCRTVTATFIIDYLAQDR